VENNNAMAHRIKSEIDPRSILGRKEKSPRWLRSEKPTAAQIDSTQPAAGEQNRPRLFIPFLLCSIFASDVSGFAGVMQLCASLFFRFLPVPLEHQGPPPGGCDRPVVLIIFQHGLLILLSARSSGFNVK